MRPSRSEQILVGLALVASVLWPVNLFNVNLGITDLLLLLAMALLLLRTWTLPFPSTSLATGILLFLGSALISLVMTPLPIDGLLDLVQYLLIFVIVVPIGAVAFTRERPRTGALIGLLVFVNLLGIAVIIQFSRGVSNPQLFYGNHNQPFWLLAVGALIHLGFALDSDLANIFQAVSGVAAGYLALLVVLGPSESAKMLFLGGGWLFAAHFARRYDLEAALAAVTAFAGVVAALGAYLFWATIQETWLYHRLPMYRTAIAEAIQSPIIGRGIGSSSVVLASLPPDIARSVHNFLLHYFLEMGIIGVAAFVLILLAWWREAVLPVLGLSSTRNVIPSAVFGGYLLVAFWQPAPIRRIWWLFFAMSWGVALVTTNRAAISGSPLSADGGDNS